MRVTDVVRNMYRILVPIDTEEDRIHSQIRFVVELPLKEGEFNVMLLHTSKEDIPNSPESIPEIKQARTHLDNEGIDVHVTIRIRDEDSAAGEIIDVAKEVDANHIVMGGRKRTPAGKVLFGSVTQSVLLNTEIPVTITGPL